MKPSLSALVIISVFYLLEGCTTTGKLPTQTAANFIHGQNVYSTSKETYPPKNPQAVSLYTNNKMPHTAYRIIGIATVSKCNSLGHHREEKTIHEMMKNLAASIGGDGIMDMNNHTNKIQANVIAFQKILI